MVLSAALLHAPGVPSAQPREDAGRLYEEGVAAFEVRDFEAALNRFQRAYVLSRRAELLMNVAVTFRRLGRPADAIATYRSYLATTRDPPNRALVEATVAQLEREAAAVSPVPATTLAPVQAAPARSGSLVVAPLRPSATAPPLWPWIAVGAGALLTVGGVVLLSLPGDPGADASIQTEGDYLAARDRRATLQTAGAILGAAGLVAATIGVVSVLLRPSSSAPRATFDVRWHTLAGGGVVEFVGAF